MGLDVCIGSDTLEGYPVFPVVLETKKRANRILEICNLDGDLIFMYDGEKIGIIEYELNLEREQCYISFFGTQNGDASAYDYRKLRLLDPILLGEVAKKGVSYNMIQDFIIDVCIPNGIGKVYLHADDLCKKVFWKNKIGNHFMENGVFTKVSSNGLEICFILSLEK